MSNIKVPVHIDEYYAWFLYWTCRSVRNSKQASNSEISYQSVGFEFPCISSLVVDVMIYAVFYYGNAFAIFQLKKFNFNLFITLQKGEDVVLI